MRRRHKRILVPAIIILVLGGLIAYLLLTPGAANLLRATETIEDKAVIDTTVIGYVGVTFADDFGYLRVPGYVDNISESEVRSLELEIQLLDAEGNKKEKISHTMESIAPGTRQTYDINAGVLPPDRTATIAITKVEVYR